ncbi:MAG: hypothetical protein CME70_15670 [Halobacteriovorax sp.]|nr:hypothetical protein [Halobacteriovorax sp.]|tara:strand:+ start:691 stop:1050 length:360 start_codon:yes stop_codon:yes gene_type:complete
MSTNTRIFPRYETENMKIQFIVPSIEDKELKVENVSLGGIKVSSPKPIKFSSNFETLLKLGSQEFNLMAYTVWKLNKAGGEEEKYSYGFRLVFSEEDNYRRWLTFMKALHQHQKNQKKK